MPPLKIPRGRRDVTGRSPPVATRSFSNEAAERDPAWAFAPPHTTAPGLLLLPTAQHHPPQGSSRATGTHSHWQGGTSSCSRHPQGTPGTLTSASNQIKLLQRSCLTSGQPCIALAQKIRIRLAKDARQLTGFPKSHSLHPSVEMGQWRPHRAKLLCLHQHPATKSIPQPQTCAPSRPQPGWSSSPDFYFFFKLNCALFSVLTYSE